MIQREWATGTANARQTDIGISGPLPAGRSATTELQFIMPGKLHGNTSIASSNAADVGLTFNMALPQAAVMGGIVRSAGSNDC